jgi:predicted NUDIX family NTP pyrophosphohydrolase
VQRNSAGILLYRRLEAVLQVFLVHPGGPFWARRDEGAWSIPKGEYLEHEDALSAAQREFAEETGHRLDGPFRALQPIRQRSGKRVAAWAAQGELDPAALRSNEFEMEWPPHSGVVRSFPEVDRGAWFTLDQARAKILPAQRPLLDEFERSEHARADEELDAELDAELDETFPASDPLPWTHKVD